MKKEGRNLKKIKYIIFLIIIIIIIVFIYNNNNKKEINDSWYTSEYGEIVESETEEETEIIPPNHLCASVSGSAENL